MSDKYLGESIGKLGFGYMRLPRIDGRFDVDAVNEMVDEFMASGFSYYDTSFIYQGSEEALRESLVKRYPRDRFHIATKIAIMMGVKNYDDHHYQLKTSLERLGLDHLDFYLIHGLGGDTIKLADTVDTWRFMRETKEKGLAKHIGFSFHGTPEQLDAVLAARPEMEFVQLQINYLDWENPEVQSRRLYEIARSHGRPVTIMEPTKGGLLAGGESNASKLLGDANPNASVASWAFRYAGGLDGLITVLSGMENIDQVRDNAATFNDFKPLTKDERALIDKAVEIINATPRIPCTSCRYCAPHCPKGIQIPMFINIYNNLLVHRQKNSTGYSYASFSSHGNGPAECIKCAECEKHCPQHIEISEVLSKLASELESVKSNYIVNT